MSDGIDMPFGGAYYAAKEMHIIKPHVFAWKWTLNGRWNEVSFFCDHAPNALHRILQRALLGIHWERNK